MKSIYLVFSSLQTLRRQIRTKVFNLKSCKLSNMYLWNDLLQSVIGRCTAIHFFEDNPLFDRKLVFLSTSGDIEIGPKLQFNPIF